MEINSENSTLNIQVPRHKIKWKICKAKRRKEDSENPRKTSRFSQLKTILIMLDEREFAAKYLPKNVQKFASLVSGKINKRLFRQCSVSYESWTRDLLAWKKVRNISLLKRFCWFFLENVFIICVRRKKINIIHCMARLPGVFRQQNTCAIIQTLSSTARIAWKILFLMTTIELDFMQKSQCSR